MKIPKMSDGVTIEELSGPIYDKFFSQQKSFKTGFVRYLPYNQVLPRCFASFEKIIKDFEVRPDDIWISSFPKCGTTWTQEMVWCIMNNLDFDSAKETTLDERVPYFELSAVTDDFEAVGLPDFIEVVAKKESPRIIKTHLSFEMIPSQIMGKNAKLIYVTRNPRDACVSFFNHWEILEGYSGDFESFANVFLEDICGYYTPFVQHVLGYWNNRHLPNVLFLTFEEMKSDLSAVLDKVSQFVGKSINPNDKPKLLEHLSFDSMKKNAAVNKQDFVQLCKESFNTAGGGQFMRKGKTGDWKSKFTPELTQKFEEWEQKHLQGSDLKFTYEI